ncbi:hypothetical protein [Natronomonas moolapensis]|nr:hypothetical protein [Natronomonas moolapensis]
MARGTPIGHADAEASKTVDAFYPPLESTLLGSYHGVNEYTVRM